MDGSVGYRLRPALPYLISMNSVSFLIDWPDKIVLSSSGAVFGSSMTGSNVSSVKPVPITTSKHLRTIIFNKLDMIQITGIISTTEVKPQAVKLNDQIDNPESIPLYSTVLKTQEINSMFLGFKDDGNFYLISDAVYSFQVQGYQYANGRIIHLKLEQEYVKQVIESIELYKKRVLD